MLSDPALYTSLSYWEGSYKGSEICNFDDIGSAGTRHKRNTVLPVVG